MWGLGEGQLCIWVCWDAVCAIALSTTALLDMLYT